MPANREGKKVRGWAGRETIKEWQGLQDGENNDEKMDSALKSSR